MTENPFASPALTAADVEPKITSRNQCGPLIMCLLGPILGALIVGVAGGMTAGLIVLPISLWEGSLDSIPLVGVFATILASVGGAVIGLVCGVSAGMTQSRFRKSLEKLTAICTALFALVCSLILGGLVADGFDAPWAVMLNIGYCLLVGCGGGTAGGMVLGRVLAAVAWGSAGKDGRGRISAREKYAPA